MSAAANLSVGALATLQKDPEIRAQLSPIGSIFLDTASLAYQKASGKSVTSLDEGGTDSEILQAYRQINALFPATLQTVASALGSVSAVAQVIPVLGQVAQIGLGIAEIVAAREQGELSDHIQFCQAIYSKGKPTRASAYGGAVPADLLSGALGGVMWAVGEGEVAVHPTFVPGKAAPVGYFDLWGDKPTSDDLKAGAVKLCEAVPGSCPHIPKKVRDLLGRLRRAILDSRKDPQSDGGISLWPVYLDLLYAQFLNGNMTWDWAKQFWRSSYGLDCWKYDERAWDEFEALMRDWGLTIKPFYAMDVAKAEDLKREIADKLAEMTGQQSILGSSALTAYMNSLKKPRTLWLVPALGVAAGAAAAFAFPVQTAAAISIGRAQILRALAYVRGLLP